VPDGLGSVRSEVATTNTVSAAQTYAPFGSPFSTHGTFAGGFGFTGEQVDSSGQVYLRARYYTPYLGVFPSLDPFEGTVQRPMSLNGYAWASGNVANRLDPSGQNDTLELGYDFGGGGGGGISIELLLLLLLGGGATVVAARTLAPELARFLNTTEVLSRGVYRPGGDTDMFQIGGVWYNTHQLTTIAESGLSLEDWEANALPMMWELLHSDWCANTLQHVFAEAVTSPALPGRGQGNFNWPGAALAAGLGLGVLWILRELLRTRSRPQRRDTDNDDWVVRAGLAEANNLMTGYVPVTVPGFQNLHGFSVQAEPGVTVEELASVGFRNAQVSYATRTEVLAAGITTNHTLTITPTRPAFGRYHATVTVYTITGTMLTELPSNVAQALSLALARRMPNPTRN
jgi:RHS repeat-associated protein